MARNIQIREPGNNYADVLHPETNTDMVLLPDGVTPMTAHLADYVLQTGYATTTGSANNYAVTLNPAPASLVEGLCVAVKIHVTNTGTSTLNVNGKGAKTIKKPNGNNLVSGNLKAGSIYTVRYNGTNFILQGSDSTGNATPEHVLAGKTFSNDAGTELTGTMPNNGAKIITPSTVNKAIPAGYHNGQGYVKGDANLVESNIRNGVTIFGIVGTYDPYNIAQSGGTSIYSNTWYSASEDYRLGVELEMLLPGTLSFYYSADAGSYSSCSAYIELNGVQYGRTVSASYDGSDNNTINVPVAPGDIISFYTVVSYFGSSSSYCRFYISCRRKMPAPALRVTWER